MKIEREELYRRVWETPMSRLAKEFDISDVGLAKACRKHAIPLPPVGYWTKLKHGKTIPKPPLTKKGPVDIELNAQRFRSATTTRKHSEVPTLPVDVQPTLSLGRLGPFTAATYQKLLKTKPDAYGFVECMGPALFDCKVGAAAIESACRLLDAIEKALPLVNVRPVKGKERLEVEHDGQLLSFKLRELHTRTEYVAKDKYYKGWEGKDYTHTFTGTFSLEINGFFEGRKRWADGKRASLGQKLGEFVQGLVAAAQAMKRRAIEFEARESRWAEEARQRAEREQEQRGIEDFRKKFLAEATASHESELMLTYLKRVRSRLQDETDVLQQPADDWLDLAERIAVHVDPTPRRVQRLLSGTTSSPSSYFGDTLQ